MKKIILPEAVKKIITRLENAGYEAYAVGGCVRDTLMERIPDDWDITTSARPRDVKKLFRHTIDTGIEHGTVTVMMGGEDTLTQGEEGYEVTTYRIDGEYFDGRHPSSVQFTPSLHEDLARRDFTINAMACNDRSGIVDDFGGMEDMRLKRIRAVGDPELRFREDALRMLRALRFSAQLGFTIDPETYAAVCRLAPNLRNVSKERIQAELSKLLLSEHPARIALVFDSGLSSFVSPHFAELGQLPPVSDRLPHKKYVRWGAVLREAPEKAVPVLRELKMDNETIRRASALAELLHSPLPDTEYAVRKCLSRVGEELYMDCIASVRVLLPDTDVRFAADCAARSIQRGDCISTAALSVSGQDLLEAGIPRGPAIGMTLAAMLEEVLRNPAQNRKSILLGKFVPRS